MRKMLPKRCVDPVMKYCQDCEYGYVIYSENVESSRDLEGCFFESGCIYGLEDTVYDDIDSTYALTESNSDRRRKQ